MGIENIRKLKEEAGLPKQKKTYKIPKKSAKKIAQEKADKKARKGEDTELQKWFKARQRFMTGKCAECGGRTEIQNFEYAIRSICHILAKRETVCPSVATHPLNFIELCEFHHYKFDSSNWEEIEKWNCWSIVKERLVMIYPDIAQEEIRHFPESVLKHITENEPF
jgi:hypothetical protein